jgi:hypothetical protein
MEHGSEIMMAFNKIKLKLREYQRVVFVSIMIISIIPSATEMMQLFFPWVSSASILKNAYGAEFIVRVNQQVFVPGDTLVVYGKGAPNDVFLARLFDATGRAVQLDSIYSDDDGFFEKATFDWPQPTPNLAFGTYTVEVSSGIGLADVQRIEVVFAEGSSRDTDIPAIPIPHILTVKLDSPSDVLVNKSFRIFVQVTIDGALVASDPAALLGRSHIHSGEATISLSDKFAVLHEGIYYADVELEEETTYIIHAMAFHDGYVSHDSRVVSAASTTIGTLQQSLDDLDEKLIETRQTVEDAGESIREDIESSKDSVDRLEQGSGQLNSIILPVLALISIILALQISLFARIRASYR